jgi:hypothetical protein
VAAVVAAFLCVTVLYVVSGFLVRVAPRSIADDWASEVLSPPTSLLLCGLIAGAVAAFYFGVYDCLKHYLIRFVLYRDGLVPLAYTQFLDHASHLAFLRKVGGCYVFYHGLLQEHFAEKDASQR